MNCAVSWRHYSHTAKWPSSYSLRSHIFSVHLGSDWFNLRLWCTMVIICTTCFNIQILCVLPTQCIYVFHMILAVNCCYFPKQHQPIVLCNGDAVFSLWCTIWFFISYLNRCHSSIDRALAQAVSRRSAPRRSGSVPGQSACRLEVHKVALCAVPLTILTALLTRRSKA